MNTRESVKKIFTTPLDYDLDDNFSQAVLNVFGLVDQTVRNTEETEKLGPDYAENNPEFLAGVVLALTIDHNARNLVSTLQEGFAAIVDELRKAREVAQ